MRPISDDGSELQATFSVEGLWPDFEVTFESGDGRGRNTDYRAGVEAVVKRLGQHDGVLLDARISSKDVIARTLDAGLSASFTPSGFLLPLVLRSVDHD